MDYNKLSPEIFNAERDNLDKLAALFPAAVKDGQLDVAALKEELGQFEEVTTEKYELTWAGKQNAKKAAQTDVAGRTLKYVPEDSKDADTTQNLYIEGDNLEVLKLLRQNYYGAVKMIYIDPPYNTGGDKFIYPDDYSMDRTESDEAEGEIIDGERMRLNQKSSNRFHAKWLSMMFSRLRIAKDLLCDDGLIFISIDDNEVDNLKKICNEIFGESNFITCITRATGTPTGGGFDGFVNELDYILVYAKQLEMASIYGLAFSEENAKIYNMEDANGKYLIRPLRRTGGEDRREDRPSMYFALIAPDGTEVFPLGPTGYQSRWICGKAKYNELLENNLIEWKQVDRNGKTAWQVYQKFYLENRTKQPGNLWTNVEGNKKATRSIRDIFDGSKVFEHPKPVGIIADILELSTSADDIILDFFSGSATTAHAIMQLNTEDNYNRRFIMVQYPEICAEGTEAIQSGYANICEIGKERIRRAGEKIKTEIEASNAQLKLGEEPKQVPDIGFRVFRTVDTNIRWTHMALEGEMTPLEVEEMLRDKDKLDFMPGYTDIDVVYEVMLRQRDIPLSAKVEKLNIGSRTYLFADAYIVCLDDNITREMVEELAAVEPTPIKYVFRDSAFNDDISLKDETVRRLQAYIARNNGEQKKTYTVEFI